ncbi:1-(5-phosphoribosyl)-5-[(5-phosphoribosylamino)methylideneamino]imidazole-4-carboxamide isomerase [Marinilabiliaceae bacterium ANBcel2]|nr:1-(5-phosphoribosyl)-5-[(5-phosphoribosylamino)methylideneamino]imidazole-4-carboxamide isomerase [Marinilabiliaceae bacterium ANBcel2]
MHNKIEIVPAIDIIDKKCVRLQKGDYNTKKVYSSNPVDVAKSFENHGITRLHVVDLDGAKAGKIINYDVLSEIATNTSLIIDFGGGVKTVEDLIIAFDSGAKMVTGGSIAVKNRPEFVSWLDKYGGGKIILGADVRDKKIAVSGWTETSDIDLFDFLTGYINSGVTQAVCTDISKDGMLQGPSLSLYSDIMQRFPELYLIASGGVSCMKDIYQLQKIGIPAVIFGKALYEGKVSLKEIENYIIK